MVPVHDTDVAEERWSQASWRTFELWERIEQQLKKTKRNWILAAILVFLILSSIPVVMDRLPKWRTLTAARQLSQELNQLKREAALEHFSYRLRFTQAVGLRFEIEMLKTCADPSGQKIREGSLLPDAQAGDYSILGFDQGEQLGIPGLVKELCYDFQGGAVFTQRPTDGKELVAFGLIPVKDLTEIRMDRITLVMVQELSAETSFY
ncbi:MAG: hypothetical protein AB7P04_01590 [Bacteriovoracia bacterium]